MGRWHAKPTAYKKKDEGTGDKKESTPAEVKG